MYKAYIHPLPLPLKRLKCRLYSKKYNTQSLAQLKERGKY